MEYDINGLLAKIADHFDSLVIEIERAAGQLGWQLSEADMIRLERAKRLAAMGAQLARKGLEDQGQ